ncbi:MAG TPA: chemotaxis protein CheA [Aliidongia sp.]|nr:chemotaxis protein CheA [Aliidongia sp.]
MSVDPADMFRQEAQELLEVLEQNLLDLGLTPDDQDLIGSAFRALHTIKGSGAMFGFDRVAAFTHHVETAFDQVRKGKVAPSPALIQVALAAKDHMRMLIEQPEQANDAAGDAILKDLQQVVDGVEAPAETAPAPSAEIKPEGLVTWRLRFRLAKDSMAMGTNPLLLLDELRELGQATVTALTDEIPSIEEIDPNCCYLAWDVKLTTDRPQSAIEEVFMFVIDDMEFDLQRIDATPVETTAIAAPGTVQPVEEVAHAAPAGLQKRREPPSAKTAAGSIRVPAERLDELMDRVGELVIAQARLRQVAASSHDGQVKSVAEEVERLVLELRDTTMGIRMLPIGSLFGRFRRLVHDLSSELGKSVELVTIGEETELDKTVVERLNDPLVHLIRNSIDHGLELPEVRLQAGKAAQGRVVLTARHAGAQVLISITDDGRGLDRDRIRARAEENGLIVPGTKLTDNELFQVLFQPGFSTAREVTSISGRGVGMDVVKRTIESLRGTIDMTSRPGGGTEVTLRLPLTLAIIDGLLIRVGSGRYVIPLSAVEECVELSPEEDARSRGRSFLNIRDELVPFLRLRELFNATTAVDPYPKVVIVSSGDLRVGLVVDQVIGDHQTVIKSLSRLHADVGTFSGATILGDGTVALILDVANLVEFGQVREEKLKAAS